MGKVHWSIISQVDLEEIGNFIARDSPYYAIDFVDRIIEQVESIPQFPFRGRVVPEFGIETVREVIFGNYRLIYRVVDGDVIVIAISHSKRDLESRSKRENWEF